MQTSKIKLGEQYAAKHDGKVINFRPTHIITTKSTDNTENVFRGYDDGVEEKEVITLSPESLIAPLAEHKEAQARLKAESDRKEAKTAADLMLKVKAARMLAKLIGAKLITDRKAGMDRDGPMVEARYGSIEVNEAAFPLLIAALEPLVK